MTLRLPDLSGPVRVLDTYGAKSYVQTRSGVTVVIDTRELIEDKPAEVPAGVAGFPVGGRGEGR